MATRVFPLCLLAILVTVPALGKDKHKGTLPEYVLNAQSVRVIVSPDAGTPLAHPTANTEAVERVERALQAWGRFHLVVEGQDADLVIAVRPGSDTLVSPTIETGPADSRIGTMQPGPGGIGVGAQQGHGPAMSDPTFDPKQTAPHVGKNVGRMKDTFEVYHGGKAYSLNSSPAWQYSAKDALKAPAVPAVAEFRKAIAEAEKQQPQSQSQKH
jgi:hypothetical protein